MLLVCLIQSNLYWLTWNTPRKINKTEKPTFEKSPWSRGENYPTKWVWRFSRSSRLNLLIVTQSHLACVLTLFFLHLGSHRKRLGLIWTQVLSQVCLWNMTFMASAGCGLNLLTSFHTSLFQMQTLGWRPQRGVSHHWSVAGVRVAADGAVPLCLWV